MGAKDLAEKNLLQYKDVFSDIVNVNLFGGRCYVSEEELSREPGELITKAVSGKKSSAATDGCANEVQEEQ